MAVLALTSHTDALPLMRLTPAEARLVTIESDTTRGLEHLGAKTWDLVFVDVDFAGGAGVELIERLTLAGQGVVAMAAQPSLMVTMRALRAGARDVIAIPAPLDRLRELLGISSGALMPQNGSNGSAQEQWVGTSPVMLEPFRAAFHMADSTQPMLLWGETGTGKELLARVTHSNGARSAEPFITLNCGHLPEPVLMAELFGQGQGALPGTFSSRIGRLQRAGRGTLYIDEAGRLPLAIQARLMEVMRSGRVEESGTGQTFEVAARLVISVDRDPQLLMDEGVLRKDFYYELSGGAIYLPSLRERGKEDIAALATYFLRTYAARYERKAREFSEDAWSIILRNPWPGNIRQMRAAVERAVLESDHHVIQATHLPSELTRAVQRSETEASLKLDDVEKQHIERVLSLTEGHLGATADMLGIHRNTLRRKLHEYDIDVE